MAIKLVKEGTSTEYSPGGAPAGTDPINMGTRVVDDTGTPATFYNYETVDVQVTTYTYTNVIFSTQNEVAALNYELSLGNATSGPWSESTAPITLNPGTSKLYIRCTVDNNGGTIPGANTQAKIRVDAVENQ